MFYLRKVNKNYKKPVCMPDREADSSDNILEDPRINAAYEALTQKTGYLAVFSILSCLKSAHLSRIARIMGKSKSTVLATIESMLAEDFPMIEVDVDTTINTRGVKKYYKLTQIGHSMEKMLSLYFNDNVVVSEEEMSGASSITREDYIDLVKQEMIQNIHSYGAENLINFFTLNSELNVYFRRTAAQGYVELARTFSQNEQVSTHEIPYASLFTSLRTISVGSFEQSLRLRQLLVTFMEDIQQLEEEFRMENERKLEEKKISSEDIHAQILSVDFTPIIDFEK